MSIIKTITPDGAVKWDVRMYENGRGSKRIFRRFDRKVDAESFVHQKRNEFEQRRLNPFAQVSFEDCVFAAEAERWLEDGKLRFSASHVVRAEAAVKELVPQFGKLTLDRFTPELLSSYQKAEKGKGLANATVNRKTNMVVAILNFVVKQRRIPFNPTAGFRKLSDNQAEMKFWDQTEAIDFLGCMNELYPKGTASRWIYVVYLLALNTAMRAGEIWGLQPIDLTNDGETILVRRQFNRVTSDFDSTKSGKHRQAPCPPVLLAEIQNLIVGLKNTDTIFRNEKGKPICHDNFSKRQYAQDLKAWAGRAIRFHDLRHTAATLLISKGVDVKTVQEICGHADISTTMNYVHMISGSVNKVSRSYSIEPLTPASVTTLKVV